MASGIYAIVNTVNEYRYIGTAANIAKRFAEHRCLLRQQRHYNSHLQRAWNKYGEQAFTFGVLEVLSDYAMTAGAREQFHLDAARPLVYNKGECARTPQLGQPVSEEAKRKISLRNTGLRRTAATRALQSALKKGKPLSAAHRVALRNRPKTPQTAETCAKIAAAKRGKPRPWTPAWKAAMVAGNRERFANLTTCKNGHPWAPDTTRLSAAGHRMCLTCQVVRAKARWQQRKSPVDRRRLRKSEAQRAAMREAWTRRVYVPLSAEKRALKGARIRAKKAEVTHCRRGHPLSGDNIYRLMQHGSLTRICRICHSARMKAYRARMRLKAVA